MLKDEATVTVASEPRRGLGRRSRLALVVAGAVAVVGLGVGLGVGLTVGRSHDGSSSPSSAVPPAIPITNLTTSGNATQWQPAVNATWQITLLNPLQLDVNATSIIPDVDIFDFDLFDNPSTTIATLHTLGKKVICYFSAGSYEPNRPDSAEFMPSVLGHDMDGWPGEKWIDVRSQNVRDIMAKRIQLAAQKGCDAVDPDNMDGYGNDNGLNLTQADAISFLAFLANQAHASNLSIGLKNAGEILTNVTGLVQFSVNEQCADPDLDECDLYTPMIEANKPVFHIEYPKGIPSVSRKVVTQLCTNTGSKLFSTVIKKMDLDGWVEFCDFSIATTMLQDSSS